MQGAPKPETIVYFKSGCVGGRVAAHLMQRRGHFAKFRYVAVSNGQPGVTAEGGERVYVIGDAVSDEYIQKLKDRKNVGCAVFPKQATKSIAEQVWTWMKNAGFLGDRETMPGIVNYASTAERESFTLPGSKEVAKAIKRLPATDLESWPHLAGMGGHNLVPWAEQFNAEFNAKRQELDAEEAAAKKKAESNAKKQSEGQPIRKPSGEGKKRGKDPLNKDDASTVKVDPEVVAGNGRAPSK